MEIDQKIDLIKERTEEILTINELRSKLEKKVQLKGYVGFELSGFVHIGNGVLLGKQVENMAKAGINMNILLADWHSLINNKLGGNMDIIHTAGEYFEIAFRTMIADGQRVKYIWGSDIVDTKDYWLKVIQVAKNSTINRIKRTLPILGRKESDDMESAFLFYGPMQTADIYEMDLDIALGGMDQRNVHVLAREVAEKIGYKKPICIHTPMLMGLKGPGGRMDIGQDMMDVKMSKSKPETCIFLHDGPKSIQRKLKKAYCPEGEINNNSVLEIARLILFKERNFKLNITRPEKFGGDIKFENFKDLTDDFKNKNIHPLDLKMGVAEALASYLKDARKKFEQKDEVMDTMSKIMNIPVDFE